MAGRQSHGRPISGNSSTKTNSKSSKGKKRSLDAFSIASKQNPDRVKIRQSRLGVKEGGSRPGKRGRAEEDEDEDEEDEDEERSTKKQRKGPVKGRFDELDVDEGSDSEGNEWKLGQVDSDDDSDLDSDEAFGESDEELEAGFAFYGSQDKKSKKRKNKIKDLTLDEDDEEDSDSELEEGDLGEGAVDLADMLNSSSDEDDKATKPKSEPKRTKISVPVQEDASEPEDDDFGFDSSSPAGNKRNSGGNSGGSEEESAEDFDDSDSQDDDGDSDNESSASSAFEDDEGDDPERLQEAIAKVARLQGQEDEFAEFEDESDNSDFGFSQPKTKKKAMAAEKLDLPRRQQNVLDRSVAFDKAKGEMNRWTETVKHNRRAEHLMFPLQDNDTINTQTNKQLQPMNSLKPFNELEATIQSILEESGLATVNGKDDEDHLREFEELETKKLSVEEVKARRDELRMKRELMFREEVKAKRVKKIKSRSYRKVHRKQREKEERQNREALEEAGFEPSEDELEKQDRRRAEERMGAKHRDSKWAKAMKGTGRAAWDEDARSGVTEMARRDEELRKRIDGKRVRNEFADNSGEDTESDSDDMSEDDDDAEKRRLLQQLNGLGDTQLLDPSVPGARLANMKFMLKADASRKQQNDAMVEDMRRELAGEESESEQEVGDIGRRAFGPGSVAQQKPKDQAANEFEEPAGSDDESGREMEFEGFENVPKAGKASPRQKLSMQSSEVSSISATEARKRRHKKNSAMEIEDLDITNVVTASQPKPKKPAKSKVQSKTQTLSAGSDSDSDSENEIRLPFAIKDQELIKRAFAGADVVGEFEAEKKQTIEDEDEKVVDNTLPGWGAWVGSGVSKKDKARNKGRFMSKIAGVKEKDRQDTKLERVIINEKKVKKNGKYLASALPHHFETKAQYERSLRIPLGPEWSTKESFQDSTKPRILLKQGIIAPMSKPLM